jgi:hypothetical protein
MILSFLVSLNFDAIGPAACVSDQMANGRVPVVKVDFFDTPHVPVKALQTVTL